MKNRKAICAVLAAVLLATQSGVALTRTNASAATGAQVGAVYVCGSASVMSGAVYNVKSVLSGKLLTVEDSGNVYQWEEQSKNSQEWRIVALENDYCALLSVSDGGKALTVEKGTADNGNNISLAAYDGSEAQQFILKSENGSFAITTRCSDGAAALDVFDLSEENGANINQWEYWGGDGQKFRISPVNNEYSFLRGDLNFDGRINAVDLALLKRGLSAGFDETAAMAADTNASSVADAEDAKLLAEFVLAKKATLPSAEYSVVKKTEPQTGRRMEYLDRGVSAVSTGNAVFVSWRSLATDAAGVGFNVYRTTDGKSVKLNSTPLTGGTNYTDTTANLSKNNTYYVKAVIGGAETDTDGDYTLAGNSTAGVLTIPIKSGGTIHFVWVGDFNGDGKYDYLVDRTSDNHQKLEAYLDDGTYLWTVDMGYNSENKNNISPGPSTIDVGMWDGATVYDIDCDGYAEALIRIADGVTFGDGQVYSNKTHASAQAIAVVDGRTGRLETTAPVPDDYIKVGPLACMMEVGYLNGETPSLVCWMKNRNSDKTFNSLTVAYHFNNGKFEQQWKYDNAILFDDRAEYKNGYAEAHQIRIADVDYDGKDEVLHMGYCLNGDGSLRYHIDEIVHGDRWYVGAFCNADNGKEMMGYGIQQDNASGLLEYFYNASTGKIIWRNSTNDGTTRDVARGNVGDIDPNYDGFECWSFQGLFSMAGEKISDTSLYPVIRLWWDGDLLSESYNDKKIEEWDYKNKSTSRLVSTWRVTDCTGSERGAPMFYADIFGDWREEVVMTSSDYSKLVIHIPTAPTDYRIYSLPQNPAYRNCMTQKGYMQSHMLDYFLGEKMETPKLPDISIIEKQ